MLRQPCGTEADTARVRVLELGRELLLRRCHDVARLPMLEQPGVKTARRLGPTPREIHQRLGPSRDER